MFNVLHAYFYKYATAVYFRFRSSSIQPTKTVTYPCRPNLTHRVFIPKSHKEGDKHPLFLDIHGGGFLLGHPKMDDEFCDYLANKFDMVVVSIQYGLAPRHHFPAAVYDVAKVGAAVISDSSLPIDPDKCAIGGFSAGGNLACAASQVDSLKGKVKACIGFYPVVDFTQTTAEKLASRWVGDREDMLETMAPMITWAYIPSSTDRKDPLLSPRWAKKEDLPPYIYFISCELDMLGVEAMVMAEALAGRTVTENGTRPSEEAWEVEDVHGSVKWEMVKGWEHGFTHVKAKGEKETERIKATQELYDRTAEWLLSGPFATK